MPIVINLDVMMAKRKIGHAELSKRLGVSETKLSLFKSGNISFIRLAFLNKVCRELQCKPADLVDYVDEETYKKLFGKSWSVDEAEGVEPLPKFGNKGHKGSR